MLLTRLDLDTITVGPRPRDVEEEGIAVAAEAVHLKTMVFDIKAPVGVIGSITVWLICLEDIRHEFYSLMDESSHQCMEFAFALFDESGDLRERFSRDGTGSWGEEVDEGVLSYLESIHVDEPFRGQGVAQKALAMIWDLEGMDPKSSFIFTWPTGTNSPAPLSPVEWGQQREDLAHLFRSVGFRRIGYTGFFCLARDSRHPSRLIPAASDAPYREKQEDTENRNDAFTSMMSQGSITGGAGASSH